MPRLSQPKPRNPPTVSVNGLPLTSRYLARQRTLTAFVDTGYAHRYRVRMRDFPD